MKDISDSRGEAEELYQKGIAQLERVKELDGKEVISAISHFHHLIFIIENIDINCRISRDYTLLGLANLGLAHAYRHVTRGINPGDIESRSNRAVEFFVKANAEGYPKESDRQLSSHVKLSMLNGHFNLRQETEQMERVFRI
ncbi:hypothetical protein [Legionella bononiensis]|uniref:Uncharacterized protein n=1 Tax=Legionella bononiensis TaxID=2793102 RepID=A0ABS1W7S7_9GAMM|nr:hypothetical protein [Legionella bononiensis]MBL7480105.1 hypothetical protein [Legionella bononiensis]MBL7525380.1 hypothetical protein [Legionella bononiensis]MBL7561564.1 hypothetical protein [Legionella bononiensis]